MGTPKNPDAYLNYFKANSELLSAMGNNFPDPAALRSAIKLLEYTGSKNYITESLK